MGAARRILALAAAALATACIGPLPTFDCGRPGVTCGEGSLCVPATGRCAEPAAACPSGYAYAPNAGDLAGECVATLDGGPGGDGGIDAAAWFTTGAAADLVLGQPDLVTATANPGGVSPATMSAPSGVCSDGTRLFVTDAGNHRILVWSSLPTATRRPADHVLGQPDLVSGGAGAGAARLSDPQIVACDGNRLVVADRGNHRVLVWGAIPASGEVAPAVVVGQTTFETSLVGGGASGLDAPIGAAVGGPGGPLAVADTGNHRVLLWPEIPTANGVAAEVVLGQADFAAEAPDRAGAPGAATLDTPAAVLFAGGRLHVADRGNHRILSWPATPTTSGAPAGQVLGQADFGSTDRDRGGAAAADTLDGPHGLCVVDGGLAIVDRGNHRVLLHRVLPTTDGAPAEVALGQPSLESDVAGPVGPTSLRSPSACAYAGGALWVADTGNHRVLRFPAR